MKIEVVNLTGENLRDAPEWESYPFSCKYCIWWEFPEECMNAKKEKKEDMIQRKLKWLRSTERIFGNCGKIVYIAGKSVCYAQYAPSGLLPRSADYKSGHPSDDAVLISCLFIPQKELRRLRIGSQILLDIIGELRKRLLRSLAHLRVL